MGKILLCVSLIAFSSGAKAQDDAQYLMETGVGGGMITYVGDFNSSIVKNIQPAGSALWRYVFNPWMGLKVKGSYGKLKGSSKNVSTYYPDYQEKPYDFNNSLGDLSVTFEYNFLPYGTGRDYRGAKRLTPFVFSGIGGTYVKAGKKNVFTGNIPLGAGMKYKMNDRMNLGLEWTMHFSLSDELDGVKDPYRVESHGLFKNTDCYSALEVSITYSFAAKCKTCHSADE